MKKLLFILLLASGSAKAQWVFPTFTNIGDTSFFHIDPNEESALLGTRKGYEAWYEYRKNQDCIIINDELTITYEREN